MPVVERQHEQIGLLCPPQHLLGIVAAGDRVAQRGAEPVEDRRLSQPAPQLRVEAAEHLGREVLHQVLVLAGEPHDRPGGVAAAAQRQRGQVQRGRPALGPPLQGQDVRPAEPQAQHLGQQVSRLAGGEAQVRGVQLGELTTGPQPGQRERRLGPGHHREVQAVREVVDEERQLVVDPR